MSPSYSEETGLFYVTSRQQCDVFSAEEQTYEPGRAFMGSQYVPVSTAKDRGFLKAIDPATGEVRWQYEYYSSSWAGTLVTAGKIVFSGDVGGNLIAFDAKSGTVLWHFQTGAAIYAAPVAFAFANTECVAIAAGNAILAFALPAK
jgi:alcohol dehydrogenase (cytochrome c)